MFEEYFLDLLVNLMNGLFAFRYTEFFLRRKYDNRRNAILIWSVIYAICQLIYSELMSPFPLYDRFLHLIPFIFLILTMQYFLFDKDIPRQMFILLSFIAGWEILRFTVSPLAHAIFSIWSPIFVWIAENFFTTEFLLINRVTVFLILLICRGIQLGIFFIYLRLISKNFVTIDYELQTQEIFYLITPCLTVLAIDLTMRLMAYSVDNGAFMLIYERVPETLILLPTVSILLLSIIVSSVVLFRGIVQFKDEEKKRMVLENRVVEVHRQIEDLQNIYGDIRGLRHDLRSHVNNLTAYIRNRFNDNELESYLSGMNKTISQLDFSYNTGNPMTDVILHQFKQQSQRKNISFSADFHYPTGSTFDVYDVSVILNNALQNAIEATEKIQGQIYLRSYNKGSLFFIEVENNFDNRLIWNKDSELPTTTKIDKQIHGIGLDNIQRFARKYSGDIEIEVVDKIFRLTVMLYRKID